MKWTNRLLPASIIISTGSLCLDYGLGRFWVAIPILLAIGGLWWWSASQRKSAVLYFCLLILFLATILGLNLFPFSGLMLVSLVSSMAAWDLDHFNRRIRSVQRVEKALMLEKAHLSRLGIVLGAGAVLGTAALLVRMQFSFAVAFLLGLVAILGLSRAIIFLKRATY